MSYVVESLRCEDFWAGNAVHNVRFYGSMHGVRNYISTILIVLSTRSRGGREQKRVVNATISLHSNNCYVFSEILLSQPGRRR